MEIPDMSDTKLSEKEQRILEAAIHIFSEKGFSAATTSEIAKSAGVAEGTIFRYFKTKKDILRGILIQALNAFSGKLVVSSLEKIFLASEGKDLRSIIREVLYDRLKLLDSVFPMARVVFTEAIYHEDVRDAIYENIISRALEAFEGYCRKAAERGLIRNDLEPQVIFRSMLGNLGILIAQKMLFSSQFAIQDWDKEIDRMTDVILYGIAPIRQPDHE